MESLGMGGVMHQRCRSVKDGLDAVGVLICRTLGHFDKINGYRTAPDSEDWENLTLAVAAGLLSRGEITATLRKLLE